MSEYIPTPAQKAFHDDKGFGKTLYADRGSGKTRALCHEAVYFASTIPAGGCGLFIAATHQALRDVRVHLQREAEHLGFHVQDKSTKMLLENAEGVRTIYLLSPDTLHLSWGMIPIFACIDEVQELSDKEYRYILSAVRRVRSGDPEPRVSTTRTRLP